MVTYNSDTRLTNTINTITITSVIFEKSTLNKTSTQHFKGKSSAHCQDRIPSLCLKRYTDVAFMQIQRGHRVVVLVISYNLQGYYLQKHQIV